MEPTTPITPRERKEALAKIAGIQLHFTNDSDAFYRKDQNSKFWSFSNFNPEIDLNLALDIAMAVQKKDGYDFCMRFEEGRNFAEFYNPKTKQLVTEIGGLPDQSLAYVLCEAILSL
jgi:hypothetical protein